MKTAHRRSSPEALLPPAPNHPLTLSLAPTLHWKNKECLGLASHHPSLGRVLGEERYDLTQ